MDNFLHRKHYGLIQGFTTNCSYELFKLKKKKNKHRYNYANNFLHIQEIILLSVSDKRRLHFSVADD